MPANITPGSCFILPFPNEDHKHLFIIISKVDEKTGNVVIVSVTTIDSKKIDSTTVLAAGDHPFIKHDSYVDYYNARTLLITHLFDLIKQKKAVVQDPVSPDILERVISGVTKSSRTKFDIRDMFLDDLFKKLS